MDDGSQLSRNFNTRFLKTKKETALSITLKVTALVLSNGDKHLLKPISSCLQEY